MAIKHTFGNKDNIPDLMEPGVYPATIIDAEEKVSKSSGNDMIEIVWELDNGLRVYDYLVFSEKTAFKVDTLLKATGNAPDTAGVNVELAADEMVGWRAFVELRVEPAEGSYAAKNKVARYVTDKGQPEPKPF
jgi:hypothetical protein